MKLPFQQKETKQKWIYNQLKLMVNKNRNWLIHCDENDKMIKSE